MDEMVDKQAVKEGVLRSLQKLNDKDTSKTAVDEMHEMIEKHVTDDLLNFTLSAICGCSSSCHPWAKKESLRLLAHLTGSMSPHASLVLSTPAMVSKMAGYLKARMNDSDGGVREVFAEVLGHLAQNYQGHKRESLPSTHAFFKAFSAKQYVMAAFAHWDTESSCGSGFIVGGADGVLPSIGAIIGNAGKPNAAGIGCLGCLASQDWAVRKGAAATLFAFSRMLGPGIEHNASAERPRVPRCVDALMKVKHDRVKPVRECAVEALNAFLELTDWMQSHPGGTVTDWQCHVTGGGSPGRRSPNGMLLRTSLDGAHAAAIEARISAAVVRSSAAFERFKAQSSAVDTVRAATVHVNGNNGAQRGNACTEASSSTTLSITHPAVPIKPDTDDWASAVGTQISQVAAASARSVDNCAAAGGPAAAGTGSDAKSGPAHSLASTDVMPYIEQLHRMLASMAEEIGKALERMDIRIKSLEQRTSEGVSTHNTLITNPWFNHESEANASDTRVGGHSGEDAFNHPAPFCGPRSPASSSPNAQKLLSTEHVLDAPSATVAENRTLRSFDGSGSIGRRSYQPGAPPGMVTSASRSPSHSAAPSVRASARVSECSEALTPNKSSSLIPSRQTSANGTLYEHAVPLGASAQSPSGGEGVSPGGPWDVGSNSRRQSNGSSAVSTHVSPSPSCHERGCSAREGSPPQAAGVQAVISGQSGPVAALREVDTGSPAFPDLQAAVSATVLETAHGAKGIEVQLSAMGPAAAIVLAEKKTLADIEAAYAKCLGSQLTDELGVLRLMQKTGPVWERFSATTAQQLLGVFNKWLRNGSNLARLRPWLFRLADEQIGLSQDVLPAPARSMTLASLSHAVQTHDPELALLHETLSAAWATQPSVTQRGPANAGEVVAETGALSASFRQMETSAYTATLPCDGEDSTFSVGGLTDPEDSAGRALNDQSDIRNSVTSIRKLAEPF